MKKTFYILTYDKQKNSKCKDSEELQEILVQLLKVHNVEKIEWWNATTLTFNSKSSLDEFQDIFTPWLNEFYYYMAPIHKTIYGIAEFHTNHDYEKRINFHKKHYIDQPLFR
jgi:hypothetical protein